MSTCNCHPSSPGTHCPCDEFVHPKPLEIGSGLMDLPRQVAGFPEFRRAMLRAISEYGPLAGWQARKDEDLGVLLIEMWAYVCDVLAFYDGVIAHESYLRTARLRPSVRKLVDLLGYLPRPATGSTVKLAALASGRQPVTVPKGTAFKSIAFGAEPPQTFEVDAATAIHPFANKWTLKRPGYAQLGSTYPTSLSLLTLESLELGNIVAVINDADPTQNSAHSLASVAVTKGDDGVNYTTVGLSTASRLTSTANLTYLSVFKANGTAKLWTNALPGGIALSTAPSTTVLYLDRQYDQIRPGALLIMQVGVQYYFGQATAVWEQSVVASSGNTIQINNSNFNLPNVNIKVTAVSFTNNAALYAGLAGQAAGNVVVHHSLQRAAKVVREPAKTLVAGNALDLVQQVEGPLGAFSPTQFLLEDKNQNGVALPGSLNGPHTALNVTNTSGWTSTLYAPVSVYGNIVGASRGETVLNEVMGSGNAGMASQQFALKKKPLTYFLSPTLDNDQGVKSTLEVWVDGIRWQEVSTFYLCGPEDMVYIVRQTDEGDSIVTFGDGRRGSRLPTGRNNVVAHYRFGAGAAIPPAGGIKQISKPAAGLQSIANPIAATPGGDAEAAEDIRSNAPQSILILGRAVSMKDMEAVAMSVPGVRVAQAEWRWSETAQRPTAHIWYVGGAGLKPQIEARLRSVSAPDTPFTVQTSTPRSIRLYVAVQHDPRYDPKRILADIEEVLLTPETGFLMPEQLGVGQHLYRSQVFAAILSVEGTKAVPGIIWREGDNPFEIWSSYGKRQHAGHHWDFETYKPYILPFGDNL